MRSNINVKDVQGRTVLSWAAERGDVKVMTDLIRCGADPSMPSRKGLTPLHYATELNNTESLKLLLSAKVDVNARSVTGLTALHIVAKRKSPAMIKLLVKHGADLKLRSVVHGTPIYHAAEKDRAANVVEVLRLGSDPNARSYRGTSLLHIAVLRNSHSVLRELLFRVEPDFMAMDDDQRDVFHYASICADPKTLAILAKNWPCSVDPTRKNIYGYAAWHIANDRRYNGEDFARDHGRRPDDDPEVWYQAFEDMIVTIEKRSGAKTTTVEEIETSSESESDSGIVPQIVRNEGGTSYTQQSNEEREQESDEDSINDVYEDALEQQ